MILCDTGPIVALIDRNDQAHSRCAEALHHMPDTSFVTTWPCFTEAMYLLWRIGGLLAQEELWMFVDSDLVRLHFPQTEELERMRSLMRQYQDSPMDLADASLVSAAEVLGIRQIFTIDSHFHVYRISQTQAFEVVP